MRKCTVYLPDDLDRRLAAEAAVSGLSKAELIRRGIRALLDSGGRLERASPIPVFDSHRPRTADELDVDLVDQVRARTGRR